MGSRFLLLLSIWPSFLPCHISCTDDQRLPCCLVHKKDEEVTTRLSLPHSCVEVFPCHIPCFNKTVVGRMAQDLFYLISGDTMLPQQLVNDVSQPNDPGYVHQQCLTPLSCLVPFLYFSDHSHGWEF